MPTLSAGEVLSGITRRKNYNNPNWEARASQYRKKYGNVCRSCRRTDIKTALHHFTYTRTKGLSYWDVPDEELGLLCQECHQLWHNALNAFCMSSQNAGCKSESDDWRYLRSHENVSRPQSDFRTNSTRDRKADRGGIGTKMGTI